MIINDISLKEILEAKSVLQKEIAVAVKNFEEKTGLLPIKIDIDFLDATTMQDQALGQKRILLGPIEISLSI